MIATTSPQRRNRQLTDLGSFLFFIHRSGAYAYAPSEPEPKLMTKEIPTLWSTINWDYQHLIWCCVDEENKEIRIGIPVGTATVPNQTLTMNYMEGLTGPIHFSQYAGREVARASHQVLRFAHATKRAHFWKKDGVSFDLELKQWLFLSSSPRSSGKPLWEQCPRVSRPRDQPLEQRPRPDIVGITRSLGR